MFQDFTKKKFHNNKEQKDQPNRGGEKITQANTSSLTTYIGSAVYGLQKDFKKLLTNVYPTSSTIAWTQP